MKEKINIAELLEDCPRGMELDCTMFDNVTFGGISNGRTIVVTRRTVNHKLYLDKYGCPLEHFKGDLKCVIFPKGKTTWEGFQRPFKDGDIIYVRAAFEWVAIYKENNSDDIYDYVGVRVLGDVLVDGSCSLCYKGDVREIRHATEEEKQKLFQAIKDNGYKWNAETMTLEKLIELKFKVGDRIQWYGTHITQPIRVVKSLEWDRYRLDNGNYIKFGDEHAYKLLKFDITTLKPYDKVLVRHCNDNIWCASFLSHINKDLHSYCYKFVTIAGKSYPKMIPYEGNEHLLGTTDDCAEYYKTWEE